MTVCIAALAEDGKAIVLVADKAITHGDNRYRPALEGESGSIEKLLLIGTSGWYALIAGDPTAAEQVVREIVSELGERPQNGYAYEAMLAAAKSAYQKTKEEAITDSILKPRLLTKESYIARSAQLLPLDSYFFRDIADRVANHVLATSLIICGFDPNGEGQLFTVSDPGLVESHDIEGFAAIGVGAETAMGVLVKRSAESEDSLEVALYQAFEAKAHAELIQGVGIFTDEWIVTPRGLVKMTERIDDLLVDVFYWANQHPFAGQRGFPQRREPPKRWQSRLKLFISKLIPPASQ